MKKTILLFVLLLNLISCKQKNEQPNQEIIALEDELISAKKEHELREEYYVQVTSTFDSLQKAIKAQAIDKNRVDAYLKNSTYFFDYKKIINTIFDQLKLDEENFLTSLNYNSIIFHSGKKYYYHYTKETSFLNYIWTNFDRSPENLNKFFNTDEPETETIKDMIYSLFKKNTIYTDSGIKNYIEALLLAYEEDATDERLRSIYNHTKESVNYSERSDFVDNITSEQMKALLNETSDSIYPSVSYRAYSFWGRRYHENNQEIVYQLLKEFYQNMEEANENTNVYE